LEGTSPLLNGFSLRMALIWKFARSARTLFAKWLVLTLLLLVDPRCHRHCLFVRTQKHTPLSSTHC